MPERLKVGVIGCGLIAQVMHLHYLRELSDRFEIAALCDVSEEVRSACARDYGVREHFATWEELISRPLDAVLVLTSGSHAPIAIGAMQAGKHVLVEKPMCFSVAEGQEMIATAESTGKTLMVGYNKRYDPAYRRLLEEAPRLHDLRLVRITTLESPIPPYVKHLKLHRASLPKAVTEGFARDDAERVMAALPDADDLSRWAYRNVLLDSLVHEFNAMRGVLGEPESIEFADIRETGLTLVFKYGAVQCVLAWVDLPSIARYSMEFAFYSPDRRLTLSFPSPFLRSAPTLLISEDGEPLPSPHTTATEEVVSYEESFKQELIHFYECVETGQVPTTSGADALHDIALCRAVVTAHRSRRPQASPSEPAMATT